MLVSLDLGDKRAERSVGMGGTRTVYTVSIPCFPIRAPSSTASACGPPRLDMLNGVLPY
jgi:hypothetical protein